MLAVCNPEEGLHQNLTTPAPWSHTSSLQDCEQQLSVAYQPRSLQYFVKQPELIKTPGFWAPELSWHSSCLTGHHVWVSSAVPADLFTLWTPEHPGTQSRDVLSTSTHPLTDLLQGHGFQYRLYADNIHLYLEPGLPLWARLLCTTSILTLPPTSQLDTSKHTHCWFPPPPHRLFPQTQLCSNCASPAAQARSCGVNPGPDTLSPLPPLPPHTNTLTSGPSANPVDTYEIHPESNHFFARCTNHHHPDPRHLDCCYSLLVDLPNTHTHIGEPEWSFPSTSHDWVTWWLKTLWWGKSQSLPLQSTWPSRPQLWPSSQHSLLPLSVGPGLPCNTDTHWPQDTCTYCFLCSEHSSPSYSSNLISAPLAPDSGGLPPPPYRISPPVPPTTVPPYPADPAIFLSRALICNRQTKHLHGYCLPPLPSPGLKVHEGRYLVSFMAVDTYHLALLGGISWNRLPRVNEHLTHTSLCPPRVPPPLFLRLPWGKRVHLHGSMSSKGKHLLNILF